MGEGGVFGSEFGLSGAGFLGGALGIGEDQSTFLRQCNVVTAAEVESRFGAANIVYLAMRDFPRGDPCGFLPRAQAALERMGVTWQQVFVETGLGELVQRLQGSGGSSMGLVDDLLGAASTIFTGVKNNLPTILDIGRAIGVINPNTGSPMAMPAGGMPMVGDGLDAFRAQCAATPGCQESLAAQLSGQAINPNTGSPIPFTGAGLGLQLGGVATGASSLLTRALADPRVRSTLSALGFGGLIAGGEAAVGALLSSGSGISATGPLLMQWPAQTAYPRGIVLRAPDKPEKRYRTRGASLLDSGDIAATRRVVKAAGRARKGRRRSSPRQSMIMLPSSTVSVCGACRTGPCACK